MSKNSVKNVFTSVIDGYSNMPVDLQFAISDLALEIERLTTRDPDSTETNMSGHCVDAPSKETIKRQSKMRLAPIREVAAKKKKQKKTPMVARTTSHLRRQSEGVRFVYFLQWRTP